MANDSIESLQNNKRESAYLIIETKAALPQELLLKEDCIQEIKSIGGTKYRLIGSNKVDLREKVFNFAVRHKVTLLELHLEKTSVEDIFQELTK